MLGLLKWISKSYRETVVYLNNEFKEYGINVTDYVFLVNIYEDSGINQEKITQHLSISKTATSKIVKKLIELNLITREKSSNDKREFQLSLTKEGKILRELLLKKVEGWENEVLKNYKEEEKKDYVKKVEATYYTSEKLNLSKGDKNG